MEIDELHTTTKVLPIYRVELNLYTPRYKEEKREKKKEESNEKSFLERLHGGIYA